MIDSKLQQQLEVLGQTVGEHVSAVMEQLITNYKGVTFRNVHVTEIPNTAMRWHRLFYITTVYDEARLYFTAERMEFLNDKLPPIPIGTVMASWFDYRVSDVVTFVYHITDPRFTTRVRGYELYYPAQFIYPLRVSEKEERE